MESATIKKSLLFSKTESTSKTESNIIFCMIAHFGWMFANSGSKVPMDGDKGDSRQGGKSCCLGEEGQLRSWEDPLNDSVNSRECTKDCLDGGIGGHLPTEFPWTGAQ